MNTPRERTGRRRDGTRGAVVVQVAVALMGLMALSVFVVDYGILWIARTEAQRVADAAALAGAVSLAYEDTPDHALARSRAVAVAQTNRIWGRTPTATELTVSFPRCPAPDTTLTCVKVDVTRQDLPSAFAHLLGQDSQRVRATATAEAAIGNVADCVRPFGLPDKWDEYDQLNPASEPEGTSDDDWTTSSTFDTYSDGRGQNPPAEPDYYRPPTGTDPGTGYRNSDPVTGLPLDRGRQVVLKLGANDSPGWVRILDFGNGARTVEDMILGRCGPEQTTTIAQAPCTVENPLIGCVGVQTGQEAAHFLDNPNSAITQLLAMDPTAHWDAASNSVAGSDYRYSPRIVPIPVFNPEEYYRVNPRGTGGVLTVTNMLGIFIEGTCDTAVPDAGNVEACNDHRARLTLLGRIVNYRGARSGIPPTSPNNTFLRTIMLVR